MALGGDGYFHNNYFHNGYWETNYWAENNASGTLVEILLALVKRDSGRRRRRAS